MSALQTAQSERRDREVAARRDREVAARRLVLTRLDEKTPRTEAEVKASLVRSHGTAWQVGTGTVLRELADEGLAAQDADGRWLRIRPRIEEWVPSLPAELRAELSGHDVAALKRVTG